MGKTKTVGGLYQRNGIWHIDKQINGRRICKSTGTKRKREAEEYLAFQLNKYRRITVFGEPQQFTFSEAAARYIEEETKKSLDRDIQDLKIVMPFIGDVLLNKLHMETLKPFIDFRQGEGVKSATINRTLAVVRLVLKRAQARYRDVNGNPWLQTIPEIPKIKWGDDRERYCLDVKEERCLLKTLSPELRHIALFLLHTGLRDQELCHLAWKNMRYEKDVMCFVLPKTITKNQEERLVVCNRVARQIAESHIDNKSAYVFHGRFGKKRSEVGGHGWNEGRKRAAKLYEQREGHQAAWGFSNLRVHDLRHTFCQRLRRKGVSLETRKALMGHANGDITTHYSPVEIGELYTALERLV